MSFSYRSAKLAFQSYVRLIGVMHVSSPLEAFLNWARVMGKGFVQNDTLSLLINKIKIQTN